jgi:hypothetical protein
LLRTIPLFGAVMLLWVGASPGANQPIYQLLQDQTACKSSGLFDNLARANRAPAENDAAFAKAIAEGDCTELTAGERVRQTMQPAYGWVGVSRLSGPGDARIWYVRQTFLMQTDPAVEHEKDLSQRLAADFGNAAVAKGYRKISGKDFKLDGRELAVAEAKVSIFGTYSAIRGNDFLIVGGSFADPVLIGLLTEAAPRETRARLLDCQEKPIYYSFNGCAITLLGTATMCTRTSIVSKTDEACLSVEDSFIKP